MSFNRIKSNDIASGVGDQEMILEAPRTAAAAERENCIFYFSQSTHKRSYSTVHRASLLYTTYNEWYTFGCIVYSLVLEEYPTYERNQSPL